MIDISAPKIIIHNLTLRGIEKVPGVLDFDQRGTLYAQDNDVVITKRPPEKDYISYLNTLGWNLSKVTFISPLTIDKFEYRSIFHTQRITSIIRKLKGFYLDSYQVTEEEKKFSDKVKIPLFANAKISFKFGTKSGFRKLCKKLKLPVPFGYENIKRIEDAIEIINLLFHQGAHAVVMKLDEGLSGAGNTKFTQEFLHISKVEQRYMVNSALKKVPQEPTHGAIIEKWIDNVIASPSIQMLVTPGGDIKILSLHDQILTGAEQWYIGCIYPPRSVSKYIIRRIKEGALLYSRYLKKTGYYGYFGLDLIIDDKNRLWWTEANMRKPGTFYPRVIAEKLFGSLQNVYYISSDFTVNRLKGSNFSSLYHLYKKFFYPIDKVKRGLVVYNTGALIDAGRFDILVFGKNYQDAHILYSQIKKRINSIV